jgi:hypothetical protein
MPVMAISAPGLRQFIMTFGWKTLPVTFLIKRLELPDE